MATHEYVKGKGWVTDDSEPVVNAENNPLIARYEAEQAAAKAKRMWRNIMVGVKLFNYILNVVCLVFSLWFVFSYTNYNVVWQLILSLFVWVIVSWLVITVLLKGFIMSFVPEDEKAKK